MVKVEKKKRKRNKPASTKGLVKGMLYSQRENKGDFKPGNDWWNRRTSHGPKVLFGDPKKMWGAAVEYFEYIRNNPLLEEKVLMHNGFITRVEEPRMRPFTMDGLTLYLGVTNQYFYQMKERLAGETDQLSGDLTLVIDYIERCIRNQKFEGAASGFLNANIISRDLGLRDAQDVTSGGKAFQTAVPEINVYNTAPPLADGETSIDTPDKPEPKKLKK